MAPKYFPRYFYRGTSTLHAAGSHLWMHADPDPIKGYTNRIYFTDQPDKAWEYSGGGYGGNVFGSPLTLRIDISQEPELRKILRKGNGEPDEWYIPIGLFRLSHEPLVVSVGKGTPDWWNWDGIVRK